jgi:hypothetical protein
MQMDDAIPMWRRLAALLGAALFAAGGVTMGSMNAGWFGLERDANSLFPLLGAGAGLVVVGFARSSLARQLDEALSAIGSITWNTETLSAFLLVGVGLLWAILALRLLNAPANLQPSS